MKNYLIEKEYGYVDWEVNSDMIGIDEEGNEVYSEDYIKINNLFIKPAFRGLGKAKEIMIETISKIESDFPGMEIKIVAYPKESCVDFERLYNFYESLGLTVIAF